MRPFNIGCRASRKLIALDKESLETFYRDCHVSLAILIKCVFAYAKRYLRALPDAAVGSHRRGAVVVKIVTIEPCTSIRAASDNPEHSGQDDASRSAFGIETHADRSARDRLRQRDTVVDSHRRRDRQNRASKGGDLLGSDAAPSGDIANTAYAVRSSGGSKNRPARGS
jgi:hypothetical protein